MEFKVEVKGIKEVLKRLSPEEFEEAVEKALSQVAEEVEARAVQKAPVRTGNLRQLIVSFVRGNTAVVGVTRSAPYAIYIHEGTGLYGPRHAPYEIIPRRKKALFWQGAEHPVKKVKHPGIKPRPFLKEALMETDVSKKFAEALRKSLP